MKWTKEQQQAIDERGRNILVAAAAGSGKTAVLVERIKKLMIQDGVPIDRMLIVTFTNAAAAEMKEKIRKALHKEIEEHPENAPKMREQLTLLPRANISTFHSFALEVIRRFFYEADIEPGFSICDDAQGTILKEEALDALLDQWFEKDSGAFYEFLQCYGSDRNQYSIRNMIDSTYKTLMAMPHPWDWLEKQVKELSASTEEFMAGEKMEYLWGVIGEIIEKAKDHTMKAVDLLDEAGLPRLIEKMGEKELKCYPAIEEKLQARDWDGLGDCISKFENAILKGTKEEKESYDAIKEQVSATRKKAKNDLGSLYETFFLTSLEKQLEEMRQTAPRAETLQRLLLDFDGLFRTAKEEKRLVDFNDIEHFCLEILERSEAAQYYQNKFAYIFIDEYQDTNILQEEIISLIKGWDNLFMVGDMKQSIYKFRLAEPEIFKAKYQSYPNEEQSMKLDLNKNFRSKSTILAEINEIFEDLMDDYDEDARLYPGVAYDGPYLHRPELKVVDAESIDSSDKELAALKNAELEALEVAELIEANLGRTFYDHKKDVERTLELRDIVLLMRATKNYADIFYQALRSRGIDAFVDDSDGYFDTIEIGVFMNLLTVIDNKRQDVPLISVLHSEIFGFTSTELGWIRAEHKGGAFSDALLAYAKEGERKALQKKCQDALESIKSWKAKSLTQPLGSFLWELMLKTGYYLKMGAMPGGTQRQANLRALIDKAEAYMEGRQVSLYSFVRYIDAVKQRQVPMGQTKLIGEQDNLVRIMTIHKSKGLEFPMVIVCGMGKQLNYSSGGSGVAIHKDVGLGMTLVNYEEHWYKRTLLQKLISRQVRLEEVQEQVRVLYVALTRAKDFLFMVGTVRKMKGYRDLLEGGVGNDLSYLNMIGETSRMEIIDANRLSPMAKKKKTSKKMMRDQGFFSGEVTPEQEKEILRRLAYRYPYEEARGMKSKYSVTELNQMEHPAYAGEGRGKAGGLATSLAVPKFRQGEKVMTAAEKGTVYHGIMEHIDFGRAKAEGASYIVDLAYKLIEKNLFTGEEIQVIDLDKIGEFFETDLGIRAAEAFTKGLLHRERPFSLQMELNGETIITQGIIDCYFEEEDGIVLLDYKTNWIDPAKPFGEEVERLRKTYEKQMEIYRKVLNTATGKPVKEVYLYLFGAGIGIQV